MNTTFTFWLMQLADGIGQALVFGDHARVIGAARRAFADRHDQITRQCRAHA
jgi:hypothetical protein